MLGLGVDAVMEDEEGQPEDPEGVLGAQFVVVDVYVELFGEAMDRECGQLIVVLVDVGEVVAGVIERAAAGEPQPAAGSRPWGEGGGEAGAGQREADADIPAASCR